MHLTRVRIDPEVAQKIFDKHGVLSEEIRNTLMEGNPIYKKVGGDQFCAVGKTNRYLTVFFRINEKRKQATVTTAYPSDIKQIKSYKKIRGK